MPTVKEYLIEAGMSREPATDLHEICLALKTRITRMRSVGAEKSLILLDLGKYRHLEQKNPLTLQQLLRINLDFGLMIIKFNDRIRLLEQVGLVVFNPATGEYEFTALGKQLTEEMRV